MFCYDKLLAKYSRLFIHPAANINNSLVIDILYFYTLSLNKKPSDSITNLNILPEI
jgi:hypothetical protein